MDGRQCVAFFTLHRGKGVAPFSDNQDAVFFRSFSVDQRYRNRGIGKVVMEKLASFITSTFQDINEIVLTVNTDNPHAMHFIANKDINIWEIVCSSEDLFILWR